MVSQQSPIYHCIVTTRDGISPQFIDVAAEAREAE